jgi:acetyltransferase
LADPAREAACVVIRSRVGGEEETGVARFALNEDGESCEFAVTVADAWQGNGIASRLMKTLMPETRRRGLKRIEGLVLTTNVRVLELCRKLGCAIHLSPDDRPVRVVRRDL